MGTQLLYPQLIVSDISTPKIFISSFNIRLVTYLILNLYYEKSARYDDYYGRAVWLILSAENSLH